MPIAVRSCRIWSSTARPFENCDALPATGMGLTDDAQKALVASAACHGHPENHALWQNRN